MKYDSLLFAFVHYLIGLIINYNTVFRLVYIRFGIRNKLKGQNKINKAETQRSIKKCNYMESTSMSYLK